MQASSSSATSAQPHAATSKGSLSEEEERRRVPLLPAEELATAGRGREIRDTMIDVVASEAAAAAAARKETESSAHRERSDGEQLQPFLHTLAAKTLLACPSLFAFSAVTDLTR